MAKYNITPRKVKVAAYRTLVSPRLMDELKEKIWDIIVLQQKYKDKDYSAKQLAKDLKTNSRYISAVINVCFKMNYTSFVNGRRIEDAKALLADVNYRHLNMQDISDMVGFSNRQSFYASFYKITGTTPRSYKIHALNSSVRGPKQMSRRVAAVVPTANRTEDAVKVAVGVE